MNHTDPSHELFPRRHSLQALFAPRSVAVIGASGVTGSVGRQLMENLREGPLRDRLFPVNPHRESVLDIPAVSDVSELPDPVDLAVIAVPALQVPSVMEGCASRGVGAAVIVSAGFREVGARGAALEREVMAIARLAGIRVLGPNSLGLVRPHLRLNASFLQSSVRPGSVALLSQSGALLSAVVDWSEEQNVGFSAAVSLGSMADVGWGEAIEFFGNDPRTSSILLYMESIGDARALLSAAREVSFQKPILVLRAGRTEQTARVAASHTGALVGSDRVLDAAFRRTGMLRVNSVAGLFYTAETLSKQPRPRGARLAIVSNAGGPALLAADALLHAGGSLAPLAGATIDALDAALPEEWSHANPVDILHDADASRFEAAVSAVQADETTDGTMVILTPQPGLDPDDVATRLAAMSGRKPLLACWMGGRAVEAGRTTLNGAGIPTFQFPDTAARVFGAMWRYAYNIRGIYETPVLPEDQPGLPDREGAARLIETASRDGRTLLSEADAKALLAAYGIPTVETHVAADEDEAVAAADAIGFPVAVKLNSRHISHKSDVGGVALGVRQPEGVRAAYRDIRRRAEAAGPAGAFEGVSVQPMVEKYGVELIVGASVDPSFGTVILFGAGGRLAEVHRDFSLGLPPLNTTLARRMMEQTRVLDALADHPATREALEALLVRFSQLVSEQPRVAEIEINPLLATPDGLLALDARAVLHPAGVPDEDLPRPAIRPYPSAYLEEVTLGDGTRALVRPIRPEDEPLLARFHNDLGEESVYMRYASLMTLEGRVAHDRLARKCFIDYDREMALVVEAEGASRESVLLGIGRLTRLPGTNAAEFGLLVADRAQGKGIGTVLLERLVRYGRDEGMERIVADILARNRPMQRVAEKLGFAIVRPEDFGDPMVQAVLDL
jgi:acetyltransferase